MLRQLISTDGLATKAELCAVLRAEIESGVPAPGDETTAVFTRFSVCRSGIRPPFHRRHLSLTSYWCYNPLHMLISVQLTPQNTNNRPKKLNIHPSNTPSNTPPARASAQMVRLLNGHNGPA